MRFARLVLAVRYSIVDNWRSIAEAVGVMLIVAALVSAFGVEVGVATAGVALVLFANFGGR